MKKMTVKKTEAVKLTTTAASLYGEICWPWPL
jgi:hypothetical protein